MNATVGGYLDLDTDLKIEFVVDADINPDELGKASPLFIRMYELASDKMMKKADFIEIYERDKEVLGADMVAVHKLKRLKPGESRTEHFVLDKKTNYVALYAEFLEFKDSKYKLIIPVVANNVIRNKAVIRVSGNDLVFDEKAEGGTGDGDSYKENVAGMREGLNEAGKSKDKVNELLK
jgi:type VI secretion system protein VasD